MHQCHRKRVTKAAPFSYSGIDHFGPLFSKSTSGPQKMWVCLFTCLVTRAIQLELLEDMSSERFLIGLRRCIACRGSPNEIISDNAGQFKLASGTIDKLLNPDMDRNRCHVICKLKDH